MRTPSVIALSLLVASSAQADWKYTRWGMTPDQVVAASGGTAELLPASERPKVPPLETAATGQLMEGDLSLRTAFSFTIDGGGLACVFYGLTSTGQEAAFKNMMTRLYGPPQATSGIPAIGMETLSWVTGTDEIDANFMKDTPPYAMHCAKKK